MIIQNKKYCCSNNRQQELRLKRKINLALPSCLILTHCTLFPFIDNVFPALQSKTTGHNHLFFQLEYYSTLVEPSTLLSSTAGNNQND